MQNPKQKQTAAARYEKAYAMAQKADEAYHSALVKKYGRAAGDARYDQRGTATPRLKMLRDRKQKADRLTNLALAAMRKAGQSVNPAGKRGRPKGSTGKPKRMVYSAAPFKPTKAFLARRQKNASDRYEFYTKVGRGKHVIGIYSGKTKREAMRGAQQKFAVAFQEARDTGKTIYAQKVRVPNAEHRDAQHPIHVRQYWQRAHEAGQKQLFQVKNPRTLDLKTAIRQRKRLEDYLESPGLRNYIQKTTAAFHAAYRDPNISGADFKKAKLASEQAFALQRKIQAKIADLDERIKTLQKQPNSTIIRRAKKVVVVEKNPGSKAQAAKQMHEMFTGKPSRKTITMHVPDGTPKELAQLGALKAIKLRGKRITLPRDVKGVLCADDRGKLHIATSIPMRMPVRNPGGDELGEILKIEYQTAKPHLGYTDQRIFFHRLGEEGGERPVLMTDANGELKIVGGDYKITREGIVD